MNSILITKAIAFGGWYECSAMKFDDQIEFRLRVLRFERTSAAALHPMFPDSVVVEGVLWFLSVEIVNLNKMPVSGWDLVSCMNVKDAAGFEFPNFNIGVHKASSLYRFSANASSLLPKLKVTGSVAFVLPDEETTYQLVLNQGNIKEA